MLTRYAFATLVSNPDYVLGATALARSLRAVNASAPLLVLTTDPDLDTSALESYGCEIKPIVQANFSAEFRERHSRAAVHKAAPFTKGNKPLFHDPLDNFGKLSLWQLDAYERIVFLDADTVVVRNIDRLFGYPEFSAAPNLYESLADMHRLNSGVFVAQPQQQTYAKMLAALDAPNAYWRRTDQTFLETFFPHWHGLPYTFNVLQYVYFNLPQLWHWPSINVVHYQYEKPWQANHARAAQLQPLIDLWQQIYERGTIPESVPAPATVPREQ